MDTAAEAVCVHAPGCLCRTGCWWRMCTLLYQRSTLVALRLRAGPGLSLNPSKLCAAPAPGRGRGHRCAGAQHPRAVGRGTEQPGQRGRPRCRAAGPAPAGQGPPGRSLGQDQHGCRAQVGWAWQDPPSKPCMRQGSCTLAAAAGGRLRELGRALRLTRGASSVQCRCA